MTDYNQMKSDVSNAFLSAVKAASREQAQEALAVYLDHVAQHIYGAPSKVNAALVEAINAGLLSPEEVLTANPKATNRLVDGVFWSPGTKGDGSNRLAVLLLPHAPKEEVIKALGLRWCLNGYRVAEKLLPFVSEYCKGGKERIQQIQASAAALLRDSMLAQKKEASPALIEEVVAVVEKNLLRLLSDTLDPGKSEFFHACVQVTAESDAEMFLSIPEHILLEVFAPGSHAAEKISSDVHSRVSQAITEIVGRLSEKLASDFEVEKPSFEVWSQTEKGQELLEEACGKGMEVMSGVAEGGSIDESKTFIIFQDWDQLHTLERYIDLDSVDHGFSDEYSACGCGNCNIAVRTEHNSWDWQPGFIVTDSIILHEHADEDDIEEYVSKRINAPKDAINCPGLDISRIGFRKLEDGFESGLHPGQNDDPETILTSLRKKFPKAEFLFRVDGVGQFDMNFSVWVRGETEEKAEETEN